MGGTVIRGYESATGYYSFNSVPEIGKRYFLRIIINNVTYESHAVTMPPVPALSDFDTRHIVATVNENSGESTPRTYQRPFREVHADIALTDALSYYRLNIRSLLQWTLSYPDRPSLFPVSYGWYSFENREQFHLVGPKNKTGPGIVTDHQLLILNYNPFNPTAADTMHVKGWIIFVELYGMSKESYDFHSQLNSQFAATGSLFDPIQTQVYGNIICKSNPLEKVYGYFNLNSYRQYRYFVLLNLPPALSTYHEIFTYPVIPDNGEVFGRDGDPPLKPDWWEE
jgi:hypothetical protein